MLTQFDTNGYEPRQAPEQERSVQRLLKNVERPDDGLEDVYRDAVWRIAKIARPEMALKYADLGCRDRAEEAAVLAGGRSLWIVERRGTVVATLRFGDECDTICWKQPELIEIAACQRAWQLLPMGVQIPIWRRLLAVIRGYEPVAHDRPEVRRLAEATFRTRVVRATEEGNKRLLEELVADCPFWMLGRAALLQQQPSDLRRWHRLLRLPRNDEARFGVEDFVRALRHAAGFLDATTDFEE